MLNLFIFYDSVSDLGPLIWCALLPIISPSIGAIIAVLVGFVLNKTGISQKIKYIIIAVSSFIAGAIPQYYFMAG
jgi:hypothetical protein